MSHFKGFVTAKNELVASISAVLSISASIAGYISTNEISIVQVVADVNFIITESGANFIITESGANFIITEDSTHS